MTRTNPRSTCRPLAQSEAGSILILTALSMVVLLGVAALAVDGSYMYTERNRMAAAADAAAKSAAMEYRRSTSSDLQAFANREVAAHGFDPAGATTVTVHRPPSSGSFTSNANYVEVIVSRPTGTFFANILGWASLLPGARAVAGTSPSPSCFVTMQQMSWGNNDTLSAANCGVAVGGNLTLGNGSIITAVSVSVTGTATGGTVAPPPVVNSPPPDDPLAYLPSLSDPGGATCTTAFKLTTDATFTTAQVNNYRCGFDFSSSAVLTLSSGIYYINGPITEKNSGTSVQILGTGPVLIYLGPSGSINLGSNSLVLRLSGWDTDPFKAIVIYQDRANGTDVILGKNGGDIQLQGAVYVPSAQLQMKNNALTANPCSVIVSRTVDIKNGGDINLDDTCASFGGSPIQIVTLAE